MTRAAAAIPAELASRRAEVAPADRSGASETTALNTEVMSAQFTRPLPTPSTVTTVHTSAPIPTPEEAGTTTTYKRSALWVIKDFLLLAVEGIGGTWWWTE